MAGAIPKIITFKPLGVVSYPNRYGVKSGYLDTAFAAVIDRPGVVGSDFALKDYLTPDTFSSGFTGLSSSWSSRFSAVGNSTWGQTSQLLGSFIFTPGEIWNLTTVQIQNLLSSAGTRVDFRQRVFSSFEANGQVFVSTGGQVGANAALPGPLTDNTGAAYRCQPSGNIQARGLGMPEAPTPGVYVAVAAGDYKLTTPAGFSGTGPNGAPSTFGPTYAAGTVLGPAGTNTQRAYRILFIYKDENNNLIRGAPSGRLVVYNPPASYAIGESVNFLYAGDIVQLYASETTQAGSGFTAEPSDDMRLVYEYVLQPADITRGYIGLNEVAPDSLRGASLYTNDTEEGILNAEQPPPPSAHSLWFKNVAWYAGTSWQGYSYTILNIIGTNGWTTGQTITFGSNVLTASTTTENPATGTFYVYSAGTAGQNLFNTARSITRAYNQVAAGRGLAAFVSPAGSTSATILFKAFGSTSTGYGSQGSGQLPTTFPMTATVPQGTTSPQLDGSVPVQSYKVPTNNRLYFSKTNQPEAVPEQNYVVVGSPGSPINGIAAVRDSLFVFKAEGLYRVTGTSLFDVKVELFDATISLRPGMHKTIAVAGNQIFALTTQGIVSITESGVSIISRAIEDVIGPLSALSGNDNNSVDACLVWPAVANASDTDHKYNIFFTNGPGEGGNTNIAYSYNFINETWMIPRSPGQQGQPDSSVLAHVATIPQTTTFDYTVFSLLSYPHLRRKSVITETGIDLNYESNPSITMTYDGGDPLMLKNWQYIDVITSGGGFVTSVTATFNSDSGGQADATVTMGPYSNNFYRVEVPREHMLAGQISVQLDHTLAGDAGQTLALSEVRVTYSETGNRVSQ